MVLIGFVLVVAGAIFGLDLLWKNTFRVPDPLVFGQSLGISGVRWLFLVGAITGAAVLLGVALLVAGVRRKGAKAVAARQERRQARAVERERDELASDNDHLRGRLDQTRVGDDRVSSSTLQDPDGTG